MTNFEVRSIVEGRIGEADGIIEDFKKRNIESGLDMSMDKQVNWPRMCGWGHEIEGCSGKLASSELIMDYVTEEEDDEISQILRT